jgi:hypothetical protein
MDSLAEIVNCSSHVSTVARSDEVNKGDLRCWTAIRRRDEESSDDLMIGVGSFLMLFVVRSRAAMFVRNWKLEYGLAPGTNSQTAPRQRPCRPGR